MVHEASGEFEWWGFDGLVTFWRLMLLLLKILHLL
jgi:hypothetical protein